MLIALDQAAPEPTSIRAVAQSFVSLLLARAGDAARTTTVANQVFATLESSPADVEVYKYLLRGVASAWALISETNTLLEPLNLIRESQAFDGEDKVSQAQERDGVLQEVARQLFWNGNIAESWLFGVVQVGDPTAKADFLVDEIEELRKAVTPDQMSGIVSQFAEADGAIVEEVPPYSAQRVLVSAATVLADIGEIDRARDLMKRVTGDLAQQVLAEWSAALEGIYEKIGSFIEIAEAFADLGDVEKSRTVVSSAVRILQEMPGEFVDQFSEAVSSLRAVQVLDQLGDFDAAEKLLASPGKEWTNGSYALGDHAAALARAGDVDRALTVVAMIDVPAVRASGLSQIAMGLALDGAVERSEQVAHQALQLIDKARSAAKDTSTQAQSSGSYYSGDEELREGSWLLSRAVRSLPPPREDRKIPDAVVSALVATGTAEDEWTRSLGLDSVLRLTLAGEKSMAVARLAELRATVTAASLDGFRKVRALRWAAELLIYLDQAPTALAIAKDISTSQENGGSPKTRAIMEVWRANVLWNICKALHAAGQDSSATEVAEAATRVAENIWDDALRAPALDRITQTYAAVGQHERALARWHQELATARASGRGHLFDSLIAGSGALAACDQGVTLWAIYQAMIEVEGWWGTLRLT